MKIAVKRSECKFYVNEKRRTVVCVIPNTVHLLEEFLESNYTSWVYFTHSELEMITLPSSFVGIARCAAEDNWDVEVGKTIAYTRARDRLYHCLFQRANEFIDHKDRDLNELVMRLNDMGEKIAARQQALHEQIAKYMED